MKLPGAVAAAGLTVALIHAPICYYFIDVLKYDVRGLSYAAICTYGIKLLFVMVYTQCKQEIAEAV